MKGKGEGGVEGGGQSFEESLQSGLLLHGSLLVGEDALQFAEPGRQFGPVLERQVPLQMLVELFVPLLLFLRQHAFSHQDLV